MKMVAGRWSLLALLQVVAFGCTPVNWGKDTGSSGPCGDDTPNGGCECPLAWTSGPIQYWSIEQICVSGDSSVGVPPAFQVVVPASVGSYDAFPTWSDYDSSTDLFQMSVANANPGSSLVNDKPNDGAWWSWSFDADCTSYTITGGNFLYIDGTFIGWTNPYLPTCDSPIPPLPPLAPDGKVPSGSQACTPGEADFDLAVRGNLASDDNSATLWLTPVLKSGGGFPERAWLREIEILNWGDATNLHLADSNEPLEVAAFAFIGGTDISKPPSGPTVVAFPAGAKPMSTLLGTESMPTPLATMQPPKVHLTWSCPSPSSTHWVPVPGHQGHAAIIPSSYGYDQRVVFWIADDGWTVRIAPEGRYADYVPARLLPASPSGRTFSVFLAAYEATFTGRLVRSGTIMELKDAVVTVSGTPIAIPDQTLTAL
ncbi:MAG: hypothetical protein R3F59_11425 [Myxococcota bacterium]